MHVCYLFHLNSRFFLQTFKKSILNSVLFFNVHFYKIHFFYTFTSHLKNHRWVSQQNFEIFPFQPYSEPHVERCMYVCCGYIGWKVAAEPLSQHNSDGCGVPHSKHMGCSFLHVLFLGGLACALCKHCKLFCITKCSVVLYIEVVSLQTSVRFISVDDIFFISCLLRRVPCC
jgi:hypothetical protein